MFKKCPNIIGHQGKSGNTAIHAPIDELTQIRLQFLKAKAAQVLFIFIV